MLRRNQARIQAFRHATRLLATSWGGRNLWPAATLSNAPDPVPLLQLGVQSSRSQRRDTPLLLRTADTVRNAPVEVVPARRFPASSIGIGAILPGPGERSSHSAPTARDSQSRQPSPFVPPKPMTPGVTDDRPYVKVCGGYSRPRQSGASC